MPEYGLLRDLLVLFGLGVVVVLVFHRIRLPPIVGLLITGVLCGPYGFGLIRNTHDVEALAEVGVLLLLFTVGIEFSMTQLVRLRAFLLLGGGVQVAGTVGLVALLAKAFGQPWPVALFLGMVVSLSSTALVLRTLSDGGETDTPHGKGMLAILIFQDLCIVPMVLLTPYLGGDGFTGSVPLAAAKALLFVGGAVIAARYVVPWLLEVVVNTRQREVFLLTVILLALGTAWASAAVGLSLALGAFIAGLVISESEYSHQALGEILPLREVFNSLFFISIGMLFDVRTLAREPVAVIGAIVAVLLIKSFVAGGVTLASGRPLRVAIIVGVGLAQIGEFSFVLSKVGLEAGLLDTRLNQIFLAVTVVTMAITPLSMRAAPRMATWIDRILPSSLRRSHAEPTLPDEQLGDLADHVVIVGYGLNGRNLARVLQRSGIRFVVIDLNPETVRSERARGRPILYGDATREDILLHAGIARARVLVIAVSDAIATRTSVVTARRYNPALHILVRTRYVNEMEPLLALGTDEVVSEEFETSIEIFSRVLRRYLVPRDVVDRMVDNIRQTGYEAMRTMPEGGIPAGTLGRFASGLTVDVVQVEPGCEMEARPLAETGLRQRTGVSIVGVQRANGERLANPAGDDTLDVGDVVLLLGRPDQLAASAALFRTAEDSSAMTAEARRLTEEYRAR
ncbi:MAG: cation:proton antiporter [Gemmatimonadaceae bacterium]